MELEYMQNLFMETIILNYQIPPELMSIDWDILQDDLYTFQLMSFCGDY